ncbi:MAG: hypothetical protein J3Q66DRAFT_283080 [Benniella sp.]|nr:MAG: hypothetical protein J3Q66DRAFT_283080 [Benniella sp.]
MATPKLIVLYDGTWCGMEAGTRTNIYLLAFMIMNPGTPFNANPVPPYNDPFKTSPAAPYIDPTGGIRLCYFPGPGVGNTFLENLVYGFTGNDINLNCVELYQYIVQNYNPGCEIWMFGLSRGAYTVRCVAGMINNCGILKRRDDANNPLLTNDHAVLTPQELLLCTGVYEFYRSRLPTHHPAHPDMVDFRERNSHTERTPVKFMGLFDTVGGLGIPYNIPGIGLSFHQFHDISVSTVVEKVYQALSIHDRMWFFEPCHALPSRIRMTVGPPPGAPAGFQYEIRERWFPGCHYDLARQRFRFLQNGANFLEHAVNWILNPLTRIIVPNDVTADLVLKWMLECIRPNDSPPSVIQDINAHIADLQTNIIQATPANTGDGDIYGNLLNYGPLGVLGGHLFRVVSRLVPQFGLAIHALTRTRDREIDPGAELTLYDEACPSLANDTVGALGRITTQRYPSQTYQTFRALPLVPLNPPNTNSSPC